MRAISMLVLGFAAAVAAVPAAAKNPKEVKIVEQPVEVTGSLNASVSGSVDVSGSSVTIQNPESEPVPTVAVGRAPYQLAFEIVAPPGSPEECAPIPVPPDAVLTITSIGIEVGVPPSHPPSAYLALGRLAAGAAIYRFEGPLRLVSAPGGPTDIYRGIYQLESKAGAADGGVEYRASICVDGPPGNAPVFSRARGVVTGHLERATIVDGATLP